MKRVSFFLFLTLVLTACSAALTVPASKTPDMKTPAPKPTLPNLGQAPELTNTVWLNVAAPLRLANLRGKVVLLDMWTLGCINCQHVIPSLNGWHSHYADQGLVIIGNHYPEFSYEADLNNLKAAVAKNEILYPVTQDNDGATWNAYKTQYWPTMYLIDKHGHLRYVQIGEGAYDQTDTAIKALLAEPASTN